MTIKIIFYVAFAFIPSISLDVSNLASAEKTPDGPAISDVPDPYGLGERLAIIAFLQDHHVAVSPDDDMAMLRKKYFEAAHPPLVIYLEDDERKKSEEKFRKELADRFHIDAPPSTSLENLQAMVAAEERARRQSASASGGSRDAMSESYLSDEDLRLLGSDGPPPVPRSLVENQEFIDAISKYHFPKQSSDPFRSDAPDHGNWLSSIVPESVAMKNHVQEDDILTSVDGRPIFAWKQFVDIRGDKSRSQRIECWNKNRGYYTFDSGIGLTGFILGDDYLIGGDYKRDGEQDPLWDEYIYISIKSLDDLRSDIAETALSMAMSKGCKGRIINQLMAQIAFNQGRLNESINAAIAALPRRAGQSFGRTMDTLYEGYLANNDLEHALIIERRWMNHIYKRTNGWNLAAAIERERTQFGTLRTADSYSKDQPRTDFIPSLKPLSDQAEATMHDLEKHREIPFSVKTDFYQSFVYDPPCTTFDISCSVRLEKSDGIKGEFGHCLSVGLTPNPESGPLINVTTYDDGNCSVSDLRFNTMPSVYHLGPIHKPRRLRMIVSGGQFSLFVDGNRIYAGPLVDWMPPCHVVFQAVGCSGKVSDIEISGINIVTGPPAVP